MKWCPSCRTMNPGRPMRCRVCGKTWDYILCKSGHVNPSVRVKYCGYCGSSSLSTPSGAEPLWARVVAHYKIILFLALAVFTAYSAQSLIALFEEGKLLHVLLPLLILLGVVPYCIKRFLGFNLLKTAGNALKKIWEMIRSD